MSNETRRIDGNPYNIESPNRLYVQWSDGAVPASYFENGNYPTGEEVGWVWEDIYNAQPHYYNETLRGAHKFRRERVGKTGMWTMPIPLVDYVISINVVPA